MMKSVRRCTHADLINITTTSEIFTIHVNRDGEPERPTNGAIDTKVENCRIGRRCRTAVMQSQTGHAMIDIERLASPMSKVQFDAVDIA